MWQTAERPAAWQYRLLATGEWQMAFGGERPERRWVPLDTHGGPTRDLFDKLAEVLLQRPPAARVPDYSCSVALARFEEIGRAIIIGDGAKKDAPAGRR